MNIQNVRRVYLKELRETLRDRRTLLVMLVVPVFLYPAMLVVIEQLALFGQRQLEEAPVSVHAQGAPPEAARLLAAEAALSVVLTEAADLAQLGRGATDVVLVFESPRSAEGPQQVTIYYDGSRDRSRRGRDLALDALDVWGDSLLARRLAASGLPRSFVQPIAVADSSVATAEAMGGYALGRFLPMLLILMTLLGAFYPAIDLSAGEKERGTLETLLTTPVPPREIVAGKFLTVTLIALAAATLNLASMLLTFQFAALQMSEALDVQLRLPWTTIVLVLLFLVPLAIFFSALFLGVALRAQSFKEAQNTLTPVQLASVIPMTLPLIPGISLSYAVAIVPIGGVALLFRELMAGQAEWGPGVTALLATIAYAVLALRFAASSFGREEVLFGTGAGSSRPLSLRGRLRRWSERTTEKPTPAEALALVAGVALLYFYGGRLFQLRLGETGLLVSQFLLLGLPAVLFTLAGRYDFRAALALRAPTSRSLLAALLIILGGGPIAWTLAWLQGFVLDLPEEFLRAMEDLVRAETPRDLAWLLLLVAVTPAICEELLFRGVLLQGLSTRASMTRSIVLSALVFGAFHLSLQTVIRFLPSAWLGALLGYVVWRTRSIFPGMLMHFVNNAMIVLLIAVPGAEGRLLGPDSEPRWFLLPIGVVLLIAGVRLLERDTPPITSESPGGPP